MSSRLRRIFRREGTSKLEFSGATSKTAPPTFVPSLIRANITNIEDPDHLEQVARLDPLANFIVYGVADMIFDDGFIFVDENGEEVMQDTLKELNRLNASKAWIQCLSAERWGGHSYQYFGMFHTESVFSVRVYRDGRAKDHETQPHGGKRRLTRGY